MYISDTEFMKQALSKNMKQTLSKKRKNWGKLALACLAFGAILGFIIGKAL